jgi:hypothetical protein
MDSTPVYDGTPQSTGSNVNRTWSTKEYVYGATQKAPPPHPVFSRRESNSSETSRPFAAVALSFQERSLQEASIFQVFTKDGFSEENLLRSEYNPLAAWEVDDFNKVDISHEENYGDDVVVPSVPDDVVDLGSVTPLASSSSSGSFFFLRLIYQHACEPTH